MNAINKIFVVFVVVILLCIMIIAVISPTDINTYENRYAEKMSIPNPETFLNNKYQNSVEITISDQLPLSAKFKKANNLLNSSFIIYTAMPYIEAEPNKYIKYKSINFFGPNQLVYDPTNLDDIKEQLDFKIKNLNQSFADNLAVDFFTYFIEKDTDINFETNQKQGLKEYVFSGLNIADSRKASFDINNITEFKEFFYSTDHHWNYKGSYKAYTELLKVIKPGDTPLTPKNKVLISQNYRGSKNSTLGYGFFSEDFYAYIFDYKKMDIMVNGEISEYGYQAEFLNGTKKDVAYGTFYGNDAGEIIFRTGNSDAENILIIGDSFDNAILKLVATHFNNTYAIDLRYYEHFMKKPFRIQSYIQEHNVDKVLLIGNINYFSSEDFILE